MIKVILLLCSIIFSSFVSADSSWIEHLDGSWKITCKEYDLQQAISTGILIAKCRERTGGQYKETFVDLKKCDKSPENIDGNLVCN